MEKANVDMEPLLVERNKEPNSMYAKVVNDRKRQHRSRLPCILLLFTTIGIFFAMRLLIKDKSIDTNNVQFIFFQVDQKESASAPIGAKPTAGQCVVQNNARYDCHPDAFATKTSCESRGCCWSGPDSVDIDTRRRVGNAIDIPYCFFPVNYPSYNGSDVKLTNFGLSVDLTKNVKSHWPNDILKLKVDVFYETKSRLRVKIYDPAKQRFEVPIETPHVKQYATDTDYTFNPQHLAPFSFNVTRKDGVTTLFDTSIMGAPLIFSDQLIQITSRVPSGMLYGLGEHRAHLYHNLSQWQQYSFWARDNPPVEGTNLYASHPFFMSFDKNNQAYGIFLLNSNAMDTDLQPTPSITFRTIGGILDFYIFTGPTPDLVVQQYTDVIGKPHMPPYWALGFHLCRWGYNTTDNLQATIKRMRAAQFPYDSQWTDIDYMDRHLDWTYDSKRFHGLPDVVEDLHNHGQHYVIITDPGISSEQKPGTYPPFDNGIKKDVFIKDRNGDVLIGVVWPGKTAFPDFTNPSTVDYWYESISGFHQKVPFDGLWIDMDEPSNFVFGSMKGCTNSSLDQPPYVPGIAGSRQLPDKTICASSQQHLSTHYNLHSMYGHTEAIATNKALEKIRNKRSLVISRSTFPSTGRYAGHWSGDNSATWHDLALSIPEMLVFQMFGIPLVGADICGFGSDTTEELCIRWMQLGAFYPFMRNHNSLGQKEQDPAIFSESAQQAMRSALKLRYRLLPYLYTLFYESHIFGTPVTRPLSFRYPEENVYNVDTQFLWGDNLLVSPVLQQGASSVNAYFPKDVWYNYDNGSMVSTAGGSWVVLPAPLDTINVHQRGGTIIPTQRDAVTTTTSRQLPFTLQIALDKNGLANGTLYWDDGETIGTAASGKYTLLGFNAKLGEITSQVIKLGYTPPTGMILEAFRIMGMPNKPSDVKINNLPVAFHYDTESKVLFVRDLAVNLLNKVALTWT